MPAERLRILLVCDADDWILGTIAAQLATLLSPTFQFLVLATQSPDFGQRFRIAQSQYDLVHFLSPWDFYSYAEEVTLPCVVTLWHMTDWKIFDKNVSRIDTLCVGSEQWKKLAKSHIPASLPLEKISYGLDTQFFSRIENARQAFISENHLTEDVLVFGFAGSGRTDNRKGLDRLWTCLTQLKTTSHQPFILRFMGRDWSEHIVPENLTTNVHFDFDKPPTEIPTFYSSLDYYACTSRQEGVPYPVLEAMSCECVVLATEVGIVPEIFEHRTNGFLIREEHLTEDFINAVNCTAHDVALRRKIGRAARETMIAKLEWADVIRSFEYVNIYSGSIRHYQHRSKSEKFKYRLGARISPLKKAARKSLKKFLRAPKEAFK